MKNIYYLLFTCQLLSFPLLLIFNIWFGAATLSTNDATDKSLMFLIYIVVSIVSCSILYAPWWAAKGFRRCRRSLYFVAIFGSLFGVILGLLLTFFSFKVANIYLTVLFSAMLLGHAAILRQCSSLFSNGKKCITNCST